jgi:hypothetical protein
MICKTIFGEKPPYDDKRITHGLCAACAKREVAEYEHRRERRRMMTAAGVRDE